MLQLVPLQGPHSQVNGAERMRTSYREKTLTHFAYQKEPAIGLDSLWQTTAEVCLRMVGSGYLSLSRPLSRPRCMKSSQCITWSDCVSWVQKSLAHMARSIKFARSHGLECESIGFWVMSVS